MLLLSYFISALGAPFQSSIRWRCKTTSKVSGIKLADENVNRAYYLQLIANLIWPILFFVLKARLLSSIWIVLLLILIIYMIVTFNKKNKLAAYLQIPYLIWTAFATYLNIGVYLLNR